MDKGYQKIDNITAAKREEWSAIRHLGGRYEVSSLGRVRSTDFMITHVNRYGDLASRQMHGKIMSLTDNGHGYLIVALVISNACRKNYYVHRLVAEMFCEKPEGCEYVNHLDYDKTNNAAHNLEWTTQRNNVLHSSVNMCKPKAISKVPLTGEKYIHFRYGHYRLVIRGKVDRQFPTLHDAVKARGGILGV